MSLNRLVLLDRDGVINLNRVDYVKSLREWQPIQGSVEAIRDIRKYCDVAICTNQSAIRRGLVSISIVNEIHKKLGWMVDRDNGEPIPIYICPHGPQDHCSCRKPKTGLLDSAIADFDADPSCTYFVGDSPSDIKAAQAAGCIPVLVRTGLGVESEKGLRADEEILVFDNLSAFSNFLLGCFKKK